MLETLRRLKSPPRFDSEELTQRARMVHVVMSATMISVTVLTFAMLVAQPSVTVRMLGVEGFVLLIGGFVLEANRRARVALAAGVLVAGLIAVIAFNALSAGGMLSPGIAMYSVVVLMAGILIGERAGEITAVVCCGVGLVLVGLESFGYLPEMTVAYNPVARWILFSVYIVVVLVLLRLANEAIAGAMGRVERELGERRAAQTELATSNADLAKRVKELRLVHDASTLLRNRSFEASILHELVLLIPPAWQYPEVCAARITYGTVNAQSPRFRDSRWRQSATFATAEGQGLIDVVYLEERPPADEGPFLDEERSALVSLGDMLGAWLERDVAERRHKLIEGQLRQSQKMEALGTLAGGIAHDFNNIIGGIVGQALLGKADSGAQHQSAGAFDAILTATKRASDLVSRILLFSRRHEGERKAMSLRPVVEEAVKLLQVGLPKQLVIRTSFGDNVPDVSGDASQLFQVAMNLGTNAVHATNPDGGSIHIDVDAVEVDNTASALRVDLEPGTHVRLTVTDTGVGMSRETVDRVYEPFFTTKGTAGTGLGLSVVHGIVKDHKGAITVESEVGRGTKVTVYLPAARATTPAAAQDSQKPAAAPQPFADSMATPRGSGEHVMFVDDDESIRATLPRIITRFGYRCSVYESPEVALREFAGQPHSFDAVLTDYTMPVMNGVELARRIKELRPEIPVALVSGHGVDAGTAAGAGIDLRIAKPVSIEVLTQSLKGMVRKAGAPGVPA